ncbi:MAG: UvrB/UvrC motif-containing protein [candidate division Zixibacteria bacterium]|nr:UvrB/UvrC motif-containing protein [candidate division Zixibacteria bacterium]
MLCQDCNKNEATIHLTQIVNNEKVVLNLCKTCAEKRGFHSPFEQMPFPLAEIVSGMVGPIKAKKKDEVDKNDKIDLKCPNCGLTFSEFGQVGRLSCAECYNTFRAELTTLLRRIHGSAEHRGHVAQTANEEYKSLREENRLRDELQRAIEDEDFEMAAELRDRIRSLSVDSVKEDK